MTEPVRIRISILHAAFDESRRDSFVRLYESLKRQEEGLEDRVEVRAYHEITKRGSLPGWLQTLEDGCSAHIAHSAPSHASVDFSARSFELCRFNPTHLTFLPDDVTLGKNFLRGLLRLVEARPKDVICCLPNHAASELAYEKGARFYKTPDGFTAFAGTLPVDLAAEHLEWRRRAIHQTSVLQGDEGVNVWAMCTGRPILKPLPGLLQHDCVTTSLDGSNLADGGRASLVFDPATDLAAIPWEDGKTLDVGRTRFGNHWMTVFDVKYHRWPNVEDVYRLHRDANFATWDDADGRAERAKRLDVWDALGPSSTALPAKHSILIAVPEYQPMVIQARASLERNVNALRAAGHRVEHRSYPGQSLITRARNLLVHDFMRSQHDVLFQWDGDVEAVAPDALVQMLALERPILAGIYPFRTEGGGVVVVPLPKPGSPNEKQVTIDEDGSACVQDAPTGFLMVKRYVLADLMMRHPERLHQVDCAGDATQGEPCWALFDTSLVETANGNRRRYMSEDWEFSRIAREAGYEVRADCRVILRHWGMKGFDGHPLVSWGVKTWEEVYGKPKT